MNSSDLLRLIRQNALPTASIVVTIASLVGAAIVISKRPGSHAGARDESGLENTLENPDPAARQRPPDRRAQLPIVPYSDVTASSGVQSHHVNGASPDKFLPESMGSGVAFLDYDGDGFQDVLLLNGRTWPGFEESKDKPTLALYRNKGFDLNGKHGGFEDVTAKVFDASIANFFGMGVTAGDFDNDGSIDLVITGLGEIRIFHGTVDATAPGGHRFVNVTKSSPDLARSTFPTAKTKDDLEHWDKPVTWYTSATFVDYDGDGLLDLFVGTYIEWSPATDATTHPADPDGKAVKGTNSFLFHNLGPEKGYQFLDVSDHVGLRAHVDSRDSNDAKELLGKAVGVVVTDVDEDGWPDLVVSNDRVRPFLFRNKGVEAGANGKHLGFEEIGDAASIGHAQGEAPRASRSVDWGEYGPGRSAILIGAAHNDAALLFRQESPRETQFTEVSIQEGLSLPSSSKGGQNKWGALFVDYDIDGRTDVFACYDSTEHAAPSEEHAQDDERDQAEGRDGGSLNNNEARSNARLFWNTGDRHGAFAGANTQESGPDLFKPIAARGCAYGDIDNDGLPDFLESSNGGGPLLFHNDVKNGSHYVRLVLEGDGKTTNRSAIGARVKMTIVRDRTQSAA